MRVARTTRMFAAFLFACQCAATSPRATIGIVAQTADALYLPSAGGIARIDKTTGAGGTISAPIPRAVSAIDVDGETVFFGTRITFASGFFPSNDGPRENFIASVANGVPAILVQHRGDVFDLHHDAAHVYWTEDSAVWRCPRAGGPVEAVAALDRSAVTPPSRLPLQRVFRNGPATDVPVFVFGAWVLYDEYARIDPHVSAVTRYALNLCDSAPPARLWAGGYGTLPPEPIPQPPPTAIDSCGIFIGGERKICFAAQTLSIDRFEIYLGGFTPSPALRSGGGDLVVVFGRGFDAATTVDVDGQPAPVLFWSDTALSVSAPKVVPGRPSVSVPLRVRNGSGGCTAELIAISDPRTHAAGR